MIPMLPLVYEYTKLSRTVAFSTVQYNVNLLIINIHNKQAIRLIFIGYTSKKFFFFFSN